MINSKINKRRNKINTKIVFFKKKIIIIIIVIIILNIDLHVHAIAGLNKFNFYQLKNNNHNK